MKLRSLLCLSALSTLPLAAAPLETGLDVLLADELAQLEGKRVGVVCNHTALTAEGEHLLDALNGAGVEITAIWAPEHGLRGTLNELVSNEVDEATGAMVYSLYDDTRDPTEEEIAGVDVLLFDIQDIGCRFYTYISTMGRVIEAGSRAGIPVIILDRPNPITGLHPEGAITDEAFLRGFTSFYPIPTRHALTVGELAQMARGEGWLELAEGGVDLTVIPCRGWMRTMDADSFGRPWVKPSPNMPGTESALLYPGVGFLEGTNLQEGRGTNVPFQLAGAPWVNAEEWASALGECELPGVHFQPLTYTPRPNAGIIARHLKFSEQAVNGVMITVVDRELFRPVRTGLAMVWTLTELYPDQVTFTGGMNTLSGTAALRTALEQIKKAGESPEGGWRSFAEDWDQQSQAHWERAAQYLLYQ